MGFVAFGSEHIRNKSIDEETFRKIAEYLGIPKQDIDRLMADNPRTIFIHRPPAAAQTAGGGGGSGGPGTSGGSSGA